jgi:enediyne biosynthesis protein E4
MRPPAISRRSFMAGLAGAALAGGEAPKFIDIAAKAGVNFRCNTSKTTQKYLLETMGGGVAMFDYDGDGRLDLYFVNGALLEESMPEGKMPDKSDPRFWNRLYHNNGDGTFTDVTERAGVRGHSYGMGVAVGDYDNDGRQDLYVTNYGRNILYHNNGDGTFTDVTEKAGVAGSGWSAGACFVDYDRDGRLDLIVSRYLEWDIHKNPWCGDESRHFRAYCHPDVFKPATHIVYHNNGDGTFTDVTKSAGFAGLPGNGLGATFNDFDRDGWPDILIANDALPQQLFRNKHDGTFAETAVSLGLAYDEEGKAYSGMGLAFADYDNDGWPDVFIGNLANQRYALYRNRKGMFEYVTDSTGIGAITALHSAWGAGFVDYDNDGWKDLFIGQGHVMDNIEQTQPSLRYREPLLLLRNLSGRFEDVSKESGEPFRPAMAARGLAFGDLDGDGFVDVAVNCLDGSAMILHNLGNQNHWLMIDTEGTASNRDGIGAEIHLIGESGAHQYATVGTAGSYLSASDKRVHLGLGQDKLIRSIEIKWPSGIVQKFEHVKVDQILRVREVSSQ